jgi:hypothetical protein
MCAHVVGACFADPFANPITDIASTGFNVVSPIQADQREGRVISRSS